jgi:hypothetical protein
VTFTGEWHPAAAVFPMMDDDGLDAVKILLEEIRDGMFPGDDKKRATDAFAKADGNLTKRANREMRKPARQGVAFGEYDHIVVLAGINPDGSYSKVNTSRCCLGDMGQDEYNRWDAIQFERAEAARRAYAQGREHFRPYLPHFARGLTVRQIEAQGLLGDEAA